MTDLDDVRAADLAIIAAMMRYGGSFVRALGEAATRADANNLRILKASFSVYWDRYATMVDRVDMPDGPFLITNVKHREYLLSLVADIERQQAEMQELLTRTLQSEDRREVGRFLAQHIVATRGILTALELYAGLTMRAEAEG